MSNLTSKAIIELLAAVKSGKLTVIKDAYGRIMGVGVNHPDLKVSEVKYVKQVGQGQVIGRTLEEMEADEEAMREWASTYNYTDVLRLINVTEILNKPTLDEYDIARLSSALDDYVDAHKEVEVRTVNAPTQRASADYELDSLSIETLKLIRREATQKGDLALKNAARRALRHNGVSA